MKKPFNVKLSSYETIHHKVYHCTILYSATGDLMIQNTLSHAKSKCYLGQTSQVSADRRHWPKCARASLHRIEMQSLFNGGNFQSVCSRENCCRSKRGATQPGWDLADCLYLAIGMFFYVFYKPTNFECVHNGERALTGKRIKAD